MDNWIIVLSTWNIVKSTTIQYIHLKKYFQGKNIF